MARGTPRSLCPPDTPDRGLLPPPPGLLVPRLLSPPLAACSCVCSMSGLLAKMQVGCSTTPRLAWVWKILLFPLPVSLLCLRSLLLQEALPDRALDSIFPGTGTRQRLDLLAFQKSRPPSPPWSFQHQSLSCVRLFVTSWIVTRQVPLSLGFSRQEYWSG